jgi:RimJ/RimL family protein N-acetyltransferase
MLPQRDMAGERLVLKALSEKDAEGPYLSWLLDAEVTRFLEARFTAYDAQRLRAYIAAENERPNAVLFGVFLRDGGCQIGTVKLSQIKSDHRNCDIGIMIGDKASWGRGLGTEAIALASRYAFETLRLHKLLAGIYSDNLGSERAFLKAGYVSEGRLIDDRWNGSRFVDRLLLGLVNPAERR